MPELEPTNNSRPPDITEADASELKNPEEITPAQNSVEGLGDTALQGTIDQQPPEDLADPAEQHKAIINANAKSLKKRFGERFVKGPQNAEEDHTQQGARELLAKFMEIEGFADDLKKLIPNKHQALKTLNDNADYILAHFEELYSESGQLEQETPKDPYELARQAGYELTGPFDTVEDFAHFEADFRPGKRICTYNALRPDLMPTTSYGCASKTLTPLCPPIS